VPRPPPVPDDLKDQPRRAGWTGCGGMAARMKSIPVEETWAVRQPDARPEQRRGLLLGCPKHPKCKGRASPARPPLAKINAAVGAPSLEPSKIAADRVCGPKRVSRADWQFFH
jgi:hypothetical protein